LKRRGAQAVLPLAAAFLSLAIGPTSAQGQVSAPAAGISVLRLSLSQVQELARSASPRLRQLAALQIEAEAQLQGAQAERHPRIDAWAQASRLSSVPEFVAPFPPPQGATVIFPDIPNRYGASLGLQIPLYTGGRIAHQILAAEKESAAAAKDLDSGNDDLLLEATASYWDLLTSRETERVFREAVASYEAHWKDAQARQAQGSAAANEVLMVQVDRDEAELARIRAAGDAEVSEADLRRLLGMGNDTRIEPTDSLTPLVTPPEDSESLVAEALAARPDRAALTARIEAAEARVGVAKSARLPQASFSAGYDVQNPNLRFFPPAEGWHDDWEATLNLSIQVFDGGRTAARVAEGNARADAARQELEALDRRIRFEVTSRCLELKTASAEVDLAEKNLQAATENRRVAGERFRAGVIPSADLLDAETALLRAGLQRTAALAKQRLSLARVQRAVGR
jgi:outer membrane protein